MSLVEMADLLQGTEEWHDQRRGMVTASVIGKLVAVRSPSGADYDCPECEAAAGLPCVSKVKRGGEPGAPIKTLHGGRTEVALQAGDPPLLSVATGDDARNLTALLVAERITGFTDPTFLNDDMLRGLEDEPRALDVYSQHHADVTTSGFMVRDDWGFRIGYSPDGLVGDEGLVEVKSRRQKKHLQTILTDEVPAENMAQLQCGLLVSGRQWLDYVSYCGGMPLYTKRVTPDPRWAEALVSAVEAFEQRAAEMVAAYDAATAGLPPTKRVIEMEMVI